jgi:hypothetical protein
MLLDRPPVLRHSKYCITKVQHRLGWKEAFEGIAIDVLLHLFLLQLKLRI